MAGAPRGRARRRSRAAARGVARTRGRAGLEHPLAGPGRRVGPRRDPDRPRLPPPFRDLCRDAEGTAIGGHEMSEPTAEPPALAAAREARAAQAALAAESE